MGLRVCVCGVVTLRMGWEDVAGLFKYGDVELRRVLDIFLLIFGLEGNGKEL